MIRKAYQDESLPMQLLLLADPSEKQIHSYVSSGHCYLAVYEGVCRGVYVLQEKTPQTIELMNVAVAESWQGKGLGKQLILHAIETSRELGYARLGVATGNSSIGQLALYQKCGFRIVGIERDYFTIHYPQPIFENGIQCRDQLKLALELKGTERSGTSRLCFMQ
ncbi:GNAT family N-acetyltransferase [Chryseomicrobium palamuruense]